ncbi:ester cyclase [Jannaschia sp. W003]|uniref:ester cyclase n=1 Tax=Jannaschia sp. W003 TaxID=2867012 RepID=UPI0021A57CDB|nr:ester cyclase [Jannaschia sp. W003]UWQ23126.1 ester cyclase [Jannaschia sp. W003]
MIRPLALALPLLAAGFALALAALLAVPATAQTASDAPAGKVTQVTTHMGEMSMEAGSGPGAAGVDDVLRFEPYQLITEMFTRDDVVFLMRHGPTDWSKLDVKDVAPDDCANQRVMIEEGRARMRDLGALMAANDVLPSRIVASRWCRNQQTVESLLEGVAHVDPEAAAAMPVETDDELNLLLSLQGARNTTVLARRVSEWDGDPERKGPLLIVTHYTNIEELTQFRVLEGEILVLDPDRGNQVLGYLRLKSATPDVGHFADALASPLLAEDEAFDMVERYYAALNAGDAASLGEVVSPEWVSRGVSGSEPDRDAAAVIALRAEVAEGLSGVRFEVDDVIAAEGTVTVRGTVHGRHDGTLFGIPATGRDVSVGAIAVHRIEDGAIAETWQMTDRAALMDQITRAE